MSPFCTSFQYKSNDELSLAHMARGIVNSVVSDKKHTNPIEYGKLILNYTRMGNQIFCIVGESLESVSDQDSNIIWPNWDHSGVVYNVRWISDLVSISSDNMSQKGSSLGIDEVCKVIKIVLDQSPQNLVE